MIRRWTATPSAAWRARSQPYIEQIFVGCPEGMDEDDVRAQALHRAQARGDGDRRVGHRRQGHFSIFRRSPCRTIVYKGLLLAPQIANFYGELSDPDVTSALCLVHQRFSTNTFPSWQLAHPYRYIAHNGEINTLRGNVNWMHARQSILASPLFGDDIKKLFPIIQPGGSDSADFDNAVELLVQSGRSTAARHGDADPGGVGRQSAHEAGEACVLRVSRFVDGTVGWPRSDRVHRWPRDRRDAGPQRPASWPLRGHA